MNLSQNMVAIKFQMDVWYEKLTKQSLPYDRLLLNNHSNVKYKQFV